MNSLHKTLILVSLLAVPAAAQSFFPSSKAPCFTAGASTYQLSSNAAAPDYRVRVRSDATPADLRMQIVDAPAIADFVIADDGDASENNLCKAAVGLKTIRVGADEPAPDVTVTLSTEADAPDYRLYVRSTRFSAEDAAALMAVMWKSAKRDFAQSR